MPNLPRPFRRRRTPPLPPVEPDRPGAGEPPAAARPQGQGDPAAPAAQSPAADQDQAASASGAPAAADPATAPTAPIPAIASAPDSEERSSRSGGPLPPSLWPDWARRLLAVLAFVAVAGIGFGVGYLIASDDDDEPLPGPAPPVIVESAPQPEATAEIGFPEFATRNTTRVGGADAIADAAGIALASYPSLGGVGGPEAVIVAPSDSWQAALASTSLAADPIAAPVLLSARRSVPTLTEEAIAGLAPQGIEDAEGVQALRVGGAAAPGDLEAVEIGTAGDDPAEIAKLVDAERARLTGEKNPDSILVVSAEEPALAMPAASWAARSGDPILFADGDDVPEATMEAIAKHENAPIYVLAPESVITGKALRAMEKEGAAVTRISNEEDPVESSIEFARFSDGDFGWNINDPGHGFVIASSGRPLDAAVAAPLSAGGKPGPLLVTTDGQAVPAALQGFLSDTQPGYVDEPERAVYNHVWLIGDSNALSVPFQAQVDELVKLAPVGPGTQGPEFGPVPGAPENEPGAEPEPEARGDGGGSQGSGGSRGGSQGSGGSGGGSQGSGGSGGGTR